jgi:hypothetical protein
VITLILTLGSVLGWLLCTRFAYSALTKLNFPYIQASKGSHGYTYNDRGRPCHGYSLAKSRVARVALSLFGPILVVPATLWYLVTWKQPLSTPELEKKRSDLRDDIQRLEREAGIR